MLVERITCPMIKCDSATVERITIETTERRWASAHPEGCGPFVTCEIACLNMTLYITVIGNSEYFDGETEIMVDACRAEEDRIMDMYRYKTVEQFQELAARL